MKFGIFYEHQLPRPWTPEAEYELFHQSLDQIELADGLGFDFAWEVEHHFLEEYSHSSAPEVFLAAASQRTKQIRLGHGIVQLTTNHPARVAERVATLGPVVARAGRTRPRRVGHHDRTPSLRRPLPRQARSVGGHGPVLPADVLERRVGVPRRARRLPAAQRDPQAAPEAAPAVVGGVFADGDDPHGRPARHGGARIPVRVGRSGAGLGARVLQRVHQGTGTAVRPRHQSEHRRRVAVHVRADRRGGPSTCRRCVVLPVRPRLLRQPPARRARRDPAVGRVRRIP